MKIEESEKYSKHSCDVDYLTFSVADHLFSLPYYNLIQIVDNPSPTHIPNMPKYVRGFIDFMGEAIPLYDIRKKIGYVSYQEENNNIIKNLMGRKQDHLNWISKLKDSVYNNHEIILETNHHKCAFGKWYDNFKTESVNLSYYMSCFDEPHKRIHSLAIEAEKLIQNGQAEDAKKLIEVAEDKELKLLIRLFDGFEDQLRKFTHEYGVVIEHAGQKISLAIDMVKYFGEFDEIIDAIPDSISKEDNNIIEAIGRRKNGEVSENILILNINNLLNKDGSFEELSILNEGAV